MAWGSRFLLGDENSSLGRLWLRGSRVCAAPGGTRSWEGWGGGMDRARHQGGGSLPKVSPKLALAGLGCVLWMSHGPEGLSPVPTARGIREGGMEPRPALEL